MIDIDILEQDLTDQLTLVKRKEVTAAEINTMQQALIEKVNPTINAFIAVAPQNSLLDSSASGDSSTADDNRALAGVTVAIKDNIDVLGFHTTAGLEVRRNNMAKKDAFVVSQLRSHGAKFSGKLNMHEGALGASNENSHFGNCFNPHQLESTPGGSSGGSGAAVSACMTPLALGSDTMGSVRIPASYCGIYGYKPSKGLISNEGTVACSRLMDTVGPMARSARDLLLAAKLMVGEDLKDPISVACNLSEELPLRPVLLVPKELEQLGVEDDVLCDFYKNIKHFEALGCQLKTFSIAGFDFSSARRAGLILCEAEMRIEHESQWRDQPEKFSPYLRKLLQFIDTKSPMDIIKAERTLGKALVAAKTMLNGGDFLIMPTTPQRAFLFTEQIPSNQADLTSLANQAGLPAVSIPMLTQNPLPAGIQLIGKLGSDLGLLNLAKRWQEQTAQRCKMPEAIKQIVGAGS